jgi:hypothetical protein
MARQIVQYKLNLRAALHHKLCCEAEKNATSLNTELNDRLQRSFEVDAMKSIEQTRDRSDARPS